MALLVPVTPVPWASAASTATPQLTALSAPAGTFDCETSPGAFITAHLTDPAGIVGGAPDPAADTVNVSYVLIEGYLLSGTLTSGTVQDGDWSFGPFCQFRPTPVWTVTKVHLLGSDGGTADITPATAGFPTTVRTVGRYGAFTSTVPASNVDTTVTIGAAKTLSGRLAWYYNGPHPVPGVVVQFWEKIAVTPAFPEGDERLLGTATTAADGTWAFTWRPTVNSFRTYVTWQAGTTPAGIRFMSSVGWTQRTWVRVAVGVAQVPGTLRAGSIGRVAGNELPLRPGSRVQLQRLSRAGWRTVATASVRASGRYWLTAQPPAPGLFTYRVLATGDSRNLGAVSRTFVIRAR